MNVLEDFFRQAALRPDAVALRDGEDFRTYGCLARTVDEMASELRRGGFLECGMGHVPRVALKCPNGIDHVVLALAIVRAGGCLVPVPTELRPHECEELLARTGCGVVVEAGRADANATVDGCSSRVVRVVGDSGRPVPEEEFAALRPAVIRFSSGTTGDSKGVVLSHRALIERMASANRRLGVTAADRVLWVLPMAHHFAVSVLLYLSQGATTVLCASRMADGMLDAALLHEVTVFYGSPFHMAVLAAEGSGRAWPGLRLAVSTAAPLREDVARVFLGRYGMPVTQGFGIIEAGLPLLNTRNAVSNPLSCGAPDDFELKLVSGGCEGDEGEVWIRGPGMFDAYLSPWQPREALFADGWFQTGDLAVREGDGGIRITGRLKSVINVGGMKCFPEEIEAVLSAHPGVLDCRVSGRPENRWGMVPDAEIVPVDAINPPRESELTAYCNRFLSAHKVPVAYHFVEAIEKTASGKIKR